MRQRSNSLTLYGANVFVFVFIYNLANSDVVLHWLEIQNDYRTFISVGENEAYEIADG